MLRCLKVVGCPYSPDQDRLTVWPSWPFIVAPGHAKIAPKKCSLRGSPEVDHPRACSEHPIITERSQQTRVLPWMTRFSDPIQLWKGPWTLLIFQDFSPSKLRFMAMVSWGCYPVQPGPKLGYLRMENHLRSPSSTLSARKTTIYTKISPYNLHLSVIYHMKSAFTLNCPIQNPCLHTSVPFKMQIYTQLSSNCPLKI